jgi:hypothetical protein
VSLEEAIFTTPCNKHQSPNCNESRNFKNFSKFENGLESILCKLYFVSKAQVQ